MLSGRLVVFGALWCWPLQRHELSRRVSDKAREVTSGLPKNPHAIVGSVCLLGWYSIKTEDVTRDLADEVCLSEEGLLEAVIQRYCVVWVFGAATALEVSVKTHSHSQHTLFWRTNSFFMYSIHI